MPNNAKTKNLSDKKLITIFEGTSGKTGKKFFEALVLNLSRALNTYGAWANVYNEK